MKADLCDNGIQFVNVTSGLNKKLGSSLWQAGRQEVRGQKIRGSGEHTLREGWDFLKNDLG